MSECSEIANSRSKVLRGFEDYQSVQKHCQHLRQEMTRVISDGQPVQLTLLWEHVVRTQKFPAKVDSHSIFHEILERLKYPEWQVRQHALRVLVDVLPTLNVDVIDENMQPVLPEVVKNLGHSAPAVRKGSLDVLRTYLLRSSDKDNTLKNIIFTELNRTEVLSGFQTNVKMGVILSTPLLLFPTKRNEGPTREILQEIVLALAARLIDVTYQKAALRSLMKIREIVGLEEFDSYFDTMDNGVKENFEILCSAYQATRERIANGKTENEENIPKNSFVPEKRIWENDEDEKPASKVIPATRVVLETEIKFNKETAITMRIWEEKKRNLSNILDAETRDNNELNRILASPKSKRKSSRRVHFGGEEIKLRTPESDETSSPSHEIPNSRIPLPVLPATRMPRVATTFPRIFPAKFSTLSFGNHRKPEAHVHNGSLSPKKSILSKSAGLSPEFNAVTASPKKQTTNAGKIEEQIVKKPLEVEENLQVLPKNVPESKIDKNHVASREEEKKEKKKSRRRRSVSPEIFNEQKSFEEKGKLYPRSAGKVRERESKSVESERTRARSSISDFRKLHGGKSHSSMESLPRQERNYILMELSSSLKKHGQEKMTSLTDAKLGSKDAQESPGQTLEKSEINDSAKQSFGFAESRKQREKRKFSATNRATDS